MCANTASLTSENVPLTMLLKGGQTHRRETTSTSAFLPAVEPAVLTGS